MKSMSRNSSFYILLEEHVHSGEKLTREQIYRKKKKKEEELEDEQAC